MRNMLDIVDDMKDWRVSNWIADQLLNGKMVRFYRDSECFHVSTGHSGWGQYRIVKLGDILDGNTYTVFDITTDEENRRVNVVVEEVDGNDS